MALWLDMTNSLRVWQGGVVGIIRAELEIAKNLKHIYPELRISVDEWGEGFKEIKSDDMEWLWNAESVADAYIKKMGRIPKENKNEIEADNFEYTDSNFRECLPALKKAYSYSSSRLLRLKRAGFLVIKNSPKILHSMEYLFGGITYGIAKTGSIVKAFYMKNKTKKNIVASNNNKCEGKEIFYPYKEGDKIISVGWYTSNKESLFSYIKSKMNNLYIIYLIYDIILIKKGTTQFYPESNEFKRYFEWITNNCDFVLYGGKTALEDSIKYQQENGLRIPQGTYIKFGSEVRKHGVNNKKILEKYNIKAPYILSVGSIEPRKNYDILYKAYSILADRNLLSQVPQIIIVGGEYRCENLINAIKIDPKIKEKIKIIHPDDNDLDLLYQNCFFVVLPTLYEGWSLTLPEALGYNKFCLVSDVKPLREVGKSFVSYVDAFDPMEWANAIIQFSTNCSLVKEKEKYIKNNWVKITWLDCAKEIFEQINKIEICQEKGNIYYDLTLVWSLSFSDASVSGILRTELILARYLGHLFPQMHFFALSTVRGYIEIDRTVIEEILGTDTIERAFNNTKNKLISLEGNIKPSIISQNYGIKESIWLMISILPSKLQKLILSNKVKNMKIIDNSRLSRTSWLKVPFESSDVVFSAGTGYDFAIYPELWKEKEKVGFKFIQLIYDYTPILLPQVHRKETIDYYKPFLEYSHKISDIIFYGGETAKKDGTNYQIKNGLPEKKGVAIKFGSNIVKKSNQTIDDTEELKKLGITGPFIIAVGSIEIRKNHETLYQAYLRLLSYEKNGYTLPQLVFAGYPGWKTEELIRTICKDERIWDKILIRTPTDEQLDVLYRNCMFTVLASHYEGWSLTLPESLNYGKFCIVSKVPPLVEIGKDFIDYVHPWDVVGWAEKIKYYIDHCDELTKKEERIANEWKPISWKDCAEQVATELKYCFRGENK